MMWPFPGLPCLGAGHRALGQGHAWPWVQVSGLTQWQGVTAGHEREEDGGELPKLATVWRKE